MKFAVVILFCATFILFGECVDIPPEPILTSSTLEPIPTPSTTTTTTTTTTTKTVKPVPSPTTTTTTTTTTPSSLSTTVRPTPPPIPPSGQWIVNGTNETCIIVHMAAQFNITYLNKMNKTVTENIVLPHNNFTNVTGVCGEKEQVINITWGRNESDSLILHFVKNETNYYSIHHIEIYLKDLEINELPNVNTTIPVMFIHNTSEYKTRLGNSYRCGKMQQISLNSNVANTTGIFEVNDLQFQAFRTDSSKTFGLAEDCLFETQDLVPIVVGCILIILVVIVLAAYLVGRRRRQSGGYLSM